MEAAIACHPCGRRSPTCATKGGYNKINCRWTARTRPTFVSSSAKTMECALTRTCIGLRPQQLDRFPRIRMPAGASPVSAPEVNSHLDPRPHAGSLRGGEGAFGDVVIPATEEVRFPTLKAGMTPPLLGAYTRTSSVAEKFEAIVQLGPQNSRHLQDFHDVWALSDIFSFMVLD